VSEAAIKAVEQRCQNLINLSQDALEAFVSGAYGLAYEYAHDAMQAAEIAATGLRQLEQDRTPPPHVIDEIAEEAALIRREG
jgi:hypothetical protein